MYAVQAICQAVTITKIGWGFLFPSHEEKSTIPNSKFFFKLHVNKFFKDFC